MTRNIIIGIIVFLFLVIVGSIVHVFIQPKPYSWYPTYNNYDKEPYGGFVLFSQLKDFFPRKIVKRLTNKDLENYVWALESEENYEEEEGTIPEMNNDEEMYSTEEDSLSYISFQDSIHNRPFNFFFLSSSFFGEVSKIKALFQHIHQGNNGLIASEYISSDIEHYLGIDFVEKELSSANSDSAKIVYSLNYDDYSYQYKPQNHYSYIEKYPENAEVIATNEYDQVIGIRMPIGEGHITFFSVPILFTNYYILKEDRYIVEELLTSLPNQDTYWSQNLQGAFGTNYPEDRSMLEFIHSNEALTWAFYTLLFTLLIYFLFQIRRKQKVIPMVAPPENTSIKFLEVLGNLYLNKRDHKDMLIKKMNYFLMWVRDEMHLDTKKVNEDFLVKLSHKSKVKLGVVKLLFERYNRCIKQDTVSSEDFILVNKLFQDFKHLEDKKQ